MESRTKRQQKKTRRNIIIAGLIMIFLMVFSMMAVYVSNQDSNSLRYGNYTFKIEQVQGSQMYTTNVNDQKYYFYTLPDSANATIANLTGMARISAADTLIFTKSPLELNQQASSEQIIFSGIATDLSATPGKTVLVGITKEDSLSGQSVFNCSNASSSTTVLVLKDGTYQSINITEVKPNCFELSASPTEIFILRDYMLYRALGIITE